MALIFAVCSPLCLLAESEPAETEPDTQLAAELLTLTVNGQNAPSLLDQNRSSSVLMEAGDVLLAKSEEPFSQAYLVWDTPPTAYSLKAGEALSLTGGQQGFIHEYIHLDEAVDEIEIEYTEGSAVLCDVYLFREGNTPAFVQKWSPPLEKADLLAMPTHADDEHLFFGGTLPLYAGQNGMDVQVVYLTNHWGEAYRPHELLNGLWTVGVTNYPLISQFPDLYADNLDAARTLYDEDEVLAYQVEALRRFKPDVIVAHDIDGEYGHGVHILNATTLLDALELAPDENAYPESAAEYGVWDVPKTYLHLWPENPVTMDWNQPLSHFGGATALEMAVEGFAQHASQQNYFAVEDFGPYDCRQFGLARSTVGPDVIGGDFFENIEEPEPEVVPAAIPPTTDPLQPSEEAISGVLSSEAAEDTGSPRAAPSPLILGALALGLFLFMTVAVVGQRLGNKMNKK